MRHLTPTLIAIALASLVGATAAPAATGDTYKAKSAECKKRANEMSFGIHRIKRYRWVKDCIAGKHPA